MPQPPGAGGLIIRDSLGGEPLQYRTTDALPEWSEVILYRRSPEEGALSVTLGLAGFGEAFFDDLRIEPIEVLGSAEPRDMVSTPPTGPRPFPAPSPPRSPTARLPFGRRSMR
jgi:hypothetical protein